MWVVKLGGSLAMSEELGHWLELLSTAGAGRVVIVPGGGPFADQVRETQRQQRFDDTTAHAMALLAMQQYGLMLSGMQRGLIPATSVDAIRAVLAGNQTAIWMPQLESLNQAAIPANWQITSDTLAAWLAQQVTASLLILVKSVAIEGSVVTLEALLRQQVVDAAFPAYLRELGCDVRICQRQDYGAVRSALCAAGNSDLTGVRIKK